MSVSADRQTPFSDAPFKYVGGDPALDLVNTVDWTARGLEHDRLSGYPRLVEWAVGAGVLEAEAGRRLLHRARRESAAAGRTLARARTLRAVLHDAVLASATHGNLAGPLARLRPWIDDVHRRRQLTPGQDGSAVWSWRDDHRVDAMLWPVVRSAAALLRGQ
ncbi:MAG: ABATE domain-containing protein, partial [Gemmatimonadales bacterium]